MSIDKTAIPQGTTAERLRGVASDETRERAAVLATRYWERASYVLLMAVAAFMRFFQLGERGLHHDESLHAYYSYNFAQALRQVFTFGTANDATWKHVPFMHGPFQ